MSDPMKADEERDLCQAEEELSVLMSIYGEDFHYLDDGGRSFSVQISAPHNAFLTVNLPAGYPSKEPPVYSLISPAVRGEARRKLDEELTAYVKDGFKYQSFLYDFIEKARECLLAIPIPDPPVHEPVERETSAKPSTHASMDSELAKGEIPSIFHGEPFTERRSTFQAHLATVHSVKDVQAVVTELKRNRKIAEATHNIMAYRISGVGDSLLSDCDDDGESQAGSRLLHFLNIVDARDVVVVVSRWFGGILLGPERFKHITNAARNILTAQGTIAQKQT